MRINLRSWQIHVPVVSQFPKVPVTCLKTEEWPLHSDGNQDLLKSLPPIWS